VTPREGHAVETTSATSRRDVAAASVSAARRSSMRSSKAVGSVVPLANALARITSAPARVMGVQAGTLASGAPADVCIFDPNAWWKVERSALRSQGKNTPFLGLEVPGRVRCTIVAGQVVHESSP